MIDKQLTQHIEDLEIRITHMEASIDELTQASLQQAQRLRDHEEVIKRLSQQIKAIPSSDGENTPYELPPHY